MVWQLLGCLRFFAVLDQHGWLLGGPTGPLGYFTGLPLQCAMLKLCRSSNCLQSRIFLVALMAALHTWHLLASKPLCQALQPLAMQTDPNTKVMLLGAWIVCVVRAWRIQAPAEVWGCAGRLWRPCGRTAIQSSCTYPRGRSCEGGPGWLWTARSTPPRCVLCVPAELLTMELQGQMKCCSGAYCVFDED